MKINFPRSVDEKSRLKTRFFLLSAAFPPVLAILVGWSLFLQMKRGDDIARILTLAEASLTESAQLSAATRAFIRDGNEGARLQWLNTYALLGVSMNGLNARSSKNPIADTMKLNYEDMRSMFDQLVMRINTQKSQPSSSRESESQIEELASQMTLRANAISINAIRLAQSTHANAGSARNRMDAIIVIFSSLLALLMGGLAYRAAMEELLARERVHADLRRSGVELSDAGVRLRRARELALEYEHLRERGEMARRAADSNRNSLRVIASSTESLRKYASHVAGNEEIEAYCKTIERAVNDTEQVLKQLGDFALADKTPVALAVNDIVNEAIEWSKPLWERPDWTRIEVAAELNPRLPAVRANRINLLEAIINVIRNAAEAMPKGGKLTLRTISEQGAVIVEISDSGIGMSDAAISRCLEPFFSTKGPSHPGMGLTVADSILKQYGGTISVQSANSKGTSVRLRLPVRPIAENVAPMPSDATAALRVLIVDDEQWSREVICRHLKEEGHTLSAFANGHDALQAFAHEQFDIVITDWAMPDMTGEELTTAVRKRKPEQIVIMATGFSPSDDRVAQSPVCADATIVKPVTQQALHDAIAMVTAKQKPGAAGG